MGSRLGTYTLVMHFTLQTTYYKEWKLFPNRQFLPRLLTAIMATVVLLPPFRQIRGRIRLSAEVLHYISAQGGGAAVGRARSGGEVRRGEEGAAREGDEKAVKGDVHNRAQVTKRG